MKVLASSADALALVQRPGLEHRGLARVSFSSTVQDRVGDKMARPRRRQNLIGLGGLFKPRVADEITPAGNDVWEEGPPSIRFVYCCTSGAF
jgi:hypothetical protein